MRADTQQIFRLMFDHTFPAFRLIGNSDPETVFAAAPVTAAPPAQEYVSRRVGCCSVVWFHLSCLYVGGGLVCSAKTLSAKVALCGDIITLYQQMSGEAWQQFQDSTWEHFLTTQSQCVNYLIRTGEYHNASVLKELITPLLDGLFECYLRTATDGTGSGTAAVGGSRSQLLWEVFRTRMAQWTHCKPAVEHWSVRYSFAPDPFRWVNHSPPFDCGVYFVVL